MKLLKQFSKTIPVFVLGILALQSCGPATSISGTWKNPEVKDRKYKNLVVVALTDNILAKQQVEKDLQSSLQRSGLQVSKSLDLFPPGFLSSKADKEEILNKVRQSGQDAILTISLLDEKTESRYVPGNVAYSPFGFNYYGSFGGYYNYLTPMMYAPGYYREDKTYFIETNLYDAQTENLIWSAQSETYNPSNLQSFSKDFAQVTADRLISEGLFITNK